VKHVREFYSSNERTYSYRFVLLLIRKSWLAFTFINMLLGFAVSCCHNVVIANC